MSNYYSSGYPPQQPQQQQQSGGGSNPNFYSQGNQAPQQQQQQQQSSSSSSSSNQNNIFSGYPQQNSQQQQQQPGASSWQNSSSAAMNTNPPQMQQQQQQPQQNNPFGAWNPAASTNSNATGGGNNSFAAAANLATAANLAAGNLSNDAMLNLGTNAAKQFLVNSGAQMIPGLETAMRILRSYFAVDNRYVKAKMQKVLFPFTSQNWTRLQVHNQDPALGVVYELPLSDENAPDLYLPFMSLITYVLLCALLYGTAGKFNPEVLPDVSTKCCVTQILEVLAIRFGLYTMQAPAAFLDLIAYTGYKYLGLVINMFIGMTLGHLGYGQRAYYITFLWTASAASFFMLKTMDKNIPLVTAATGPKRQFMVLGFAVSQFITMFFVSQTKFLDYNVNADVGSASGGMPAVDSTASDGVMDEMTD